LQEIIDIIFHQLVIVSVFGDNIFIVLASFLCGSIYLYKHKHHFTVFVFLLTGISYFYSLYLKYLFLHPRPEEALGRVYSFDIYGFPSSHVVFYTAFWGFIIYLTFKYIKEEKLILHIVRSIAVYFVLFVGVSRVALGMHYPKDVISGYFFGGLFLGLLIWLDRKIPEVISKN
jgi:membrane-associated phospholipid phosphatase